MKESKNMIKEASGTTSHWYSGMTFLLRLLAVAAASLVVCASALAAPDDSVSVQMWSGMPLQRSTESVSVTVSRYRYRGWSEPGNEIEIDRFFEEVRRILAETEAPPEWSRLYVDAPDVKLDITLDGRRFQLACSSFRSECSLPDNASATDKRVASAIQRILNLVAERVSQALGAKR
jgi:hypothetical protein